ncbi:MAG: hypothetical protein LBK22_06540, partial [Tannerella sp.]|nr:hypothetical protein [Tannerella sp.]
MDQDILSWIKTVYCLDSRYSDIIHANQQLNRQTPSGVGPRNAQNRSIHSIPSFLTADSHYTARGMVLCNARQGIHINRMEDQQKRLIARQGIHLLP